MLVVSLILADRAPIKLVILISIHVLKYLNFYLFLCVPITLGFRTFFIEHIDCSSFNNLFPPTYFILTLTASIYGTNGQGMFIIIQICLFFPFINIQAFACGGARVENVRAWL